MYKSTIWILGEYSDNKDAIFRILELIKDSLGEIPIIESDEIRDKEGGEDSNKRDKSEKQTAVSVL